MKFTLPANAFPDLELTSEEQRQLIDEANRVLDETIVVNEAFLAGGRQFPRQDWKPVRAKEGISVYKQRNTTAVVEAARRKDRATSSDSSASSSSSSSSSKRGGTREGHTNSASSSERSRPATTTSYVEKIKRPQVPLLVLNGLLDGTLEDTMYGCFADTDESWRWRSTHVNERFDDAKILTKVLGPTPAEPFRYLGVKWFIKEHPAVLSQVVKRRDFLILEATGITKDSRGDPVGYLLMHSMAVARIPELRGLDVVRANLSFCYLIRPHTESTVEIYCRGFTDPQGDMIETVSVLLAAESLIAAVSVVDYANVKKLKWLMAQRQQQQPRRESQVVTPGRSDACASCSRTLHRFGILSAQGAPCHTCRKVVCARCSLLKKLTVDIVAGVAMQKPLNFCLACVLEAKELPAWDLASATVPPPATDEFRSPAPLPLKRVSSRGRQARTHRAASTHAAMTPTSTTTSPRLSERYPQTPQQLTPKTPAKPVRRAPPPPPPVPQDQKKLTVSRSSEVASARS